MKDAERKKMVAAKVKAQKATKVKAAKKEAGSRGEIGKFGFGVNTANHLFCVALSKKPATMAEVKKMAWNKKKQTFYTCFKALRAKGMVKIDKNKKMSIVKKAKPATKKKK